MCVHTLALMGMSHDGTVLSPTFTPTVFLQDMDAVQLHDL